MDSNKIDISDKLKDLHKITKFDEFKKKIERLETRRMRIS